MCNGLIHAGLLFFRHGANTTRFIDVWQQRLDADSKVGTMAAQTREADGVLHTGLAVGEGAVLPGCSSCRLGLTRLSMSARLFMLLLFSSIVYLLTNGCRPGTRMCSTRWRTTDWRHLSRRPTSRAW